MPAVIESADTAKAEEPVSGDFVCAFLLPLNLPYYIPLLPSITSDCCRLDYYVSFLSKMV